MSTYLTKIVPADDVRAGDRIVHHGQLLTLFTADDRPGAPLLINAWVRTGKRRDERWLPEADAVRVYVWATVNDPDLDPDLDPGYHAPQVRNPRAEGDGWAEVVVVADARREAFAKKAETLAKRARKLGREVTVAHALDSYCDWRWDDDLRRSLPHPRTLFQLDLGEPVGIDGWRLVGKVSRLPATERTLVSTAPSFDGDLPARFREHDLRCEHCKKSRRRKDVLVLKNEGNGHYKAVGRSCLADFFTTDPGQVLSWYDFECSTRERLGDDWDDDECLGAAERPLDLTTWLLLCWSLAEANGWISKGEALNRCTTSTADSAQAWLANGKAKGWRREDLLPEGIDESLEPTVASAIEWAAAQADARSDYLANLATIAGSEFVVERTRGLAASLYIAYKRHVEGETKRKAEAEASAESDYIGEPKQRVEIGRATVTATRCIDGFYGTTHLYRFLTGVGDVVTWFAASDQGLSEGDVVDLEAATVKKHDEYQGVRQTVVNRVRLSTLKEDVTPNA